MTLRLASQVPIPESFGRIKVQSMAYNDDSSMRFTDVPLEQCSDEETEQTIEFMLSRGY